MKNPIDSAYKILRDSIITFEGRPIGTVASLHPDLPAENYQECFVRDFMPSATVFLHDGEYEIVRNFLETVLQLHKQQRCIVGHKIVPGVLPASFKVVQASGGREELIADFGDRAIGRVAPVDSIMFWVTLLARYVEITDDADFARQPVIQEALRDILNLLLKDSFEIYPTLLTPDGSFMVDRRMGVYGHPLEVQALFYGVLRLMPFLMAHDDENKKSLELAKKREEILRDYVRKYYWLDIERLNEIHRFKTEQFGYEISNVLNIYPESIPGWVVDWLPDNAGYLAGNIGPGRMDFRFFALGNLLAIILGLADEEESSAIFNLFEARWNDLVGDMPLKICYPALEGPEWKLITGCDPKNVAWSYHNGGNWPCLMWAFTGAAMRTGRREPARRAFEIACRRLPEDDWPEYYDGKNGRLIGRRASFKQVWSASSLIVSHKVLEDPDLVSKLI